MAVIVALLVQRVFWVAEYAAPKLEMAWVSGTVNASSLAAFMLYPC